MTDITVGKIVGSISETDVAKTYEVINSLERPCCGLVSVGTDVVPVRVPEVVKVAAAVYCNLPKEVLDPWLGDISLSLLRTPAFMHNNYPLLLYQAFLGP